MEKSRKAQFASASAKLMNSWTEMETATPVDPTKSFPTDSVSAQLDTAATAVESALSPVAKDSSPSKEDAPSVPSTPSTKPRSTAVTAPLATTKTYSESVKNWS